MDNIFADDLTPELKLKIAQAYRAKITPRAIAKYLGVSISQVKHVISEDEKRHAELEEWAQVLRYSGSSASDP
jgi:DNA invertase Pin-like site-specific DNA recombinase